MLHGSECARPHQTLPSDPRSRPGAEPATRLRRLRREERLHREQRLHREERLHRLTREERGYSLVEVMLSMIVTVVGVMGTVSLVDGANGRTASTIAREGANGLARQVIEGARAVPYPQLTPGSIDAQLQAQPGLADGELGGEWTINRRSVTYTIDADVCWMDDPADGAGQHDSGSFCPDTIPAGVTDGNPDDYKRVVVELSWRKGNNIDRIKRTALVNNPGNAVGPAITDLLMTSPTSAEVTAIVPAVAFALTTSSPPATVGWSVDGTPQGNATGAGIAWVFTWDIVSLLDGSYLVSAQAFDQSGASGAKQALTVTLNRFAAIAPEGFAAGRNGDAVELEWRPNKERDIVGYRVYRLASDGGADVQVCSLTTAHSCRDTSAPDEDGIAYYVVAVDRDPSDSYREGAHSVTRTVNRNNAPPYPPTNLNGVRNADGTVTLTWEPPTTADPDGDGIDFYRIYRDGTAYADRYDRTGLGTELDYTDKSPGGDGHTYYVAAVDSQLAESTAIGPVGP